MTEKINSFTENESQQKIYAPLNGTLLAGTHRMCDLIPVMLRAIRETPEYAQLTNHLPGVVTDPSATEWDSRWESEEVRDLYDELTGVLEQYAPEGYYFGSHIDNSSDLGYWRKDTYMLGAITSLAKAYSPIVLNKDMELFYTPFYNKDLTPVNVHDIQLRKGAVMVGDNNHRVNIDSLNKDSVEKLYHAIEASKVQHLEVIAKNLIGDNIRFDFWEHQDIDRIDLGSMPDTICIDAITVKDGKLSMFSEDLNMDIDIKALKDHEVTRAIYTFGEVKKSIEKHRMDVIEALKERVVTPTMRCFSDDAFERIRSFADMHLDKDDLNKKVNAIKEDVKADKEVGRLPAEWFTAASEEFNDIVNGVERDNSRGLKL